MEDYLNKNEILVVPKQVVSPAVAMDSSFIYMDIFGCCRDFEEGD